ncbi:glycosyl transferase family 90-domain-containing protein [Aspergillus novoparasiticus]|uniref:Glycosyl transferase family 90-domain-containing protein n=1 Tax=Aspergillus novoparasiticus TaxID=986946 RepID=A0A5N6F936_9EURO|nr:glycosyl transferase family 90-domain-containing protein [Aspergillus novoparasiticus]
MAIPSCSRWRLRPIGLLYLFYFVGFMSFACIVAIWYGVNSDRDYIHPLLTQLIPAGHCACQTSTTFQCATCLSCSEHSLVPQLTSAPKWEFNSDRDSNNEGLSTPQCTAAFPGLYEDVFRAESFWRSQGALATEDLDRIPLGFGMVRAFISRGELYVVAARAKQEDHRRKIVAALSSIHRALVADSDRATRRDIEFVFSVEDKVEDVTSSDNPVWVLARSAAEQGVWLMPDFGFWAWDNPRNSIGPFDQVVERVKRADIPWSQKTPQLVWRGKPSFAPKLRRALMDAARDKPWGDVKQVNWFERTNIMSMEDHCRYMFIAHVEGRSYSASLKYRQACNSVIVAHKLQYIQHHHYLLVPDGPNQNYIEVERDFSDLESKIEPLLDDPSTAQRIANNSVRTFRERYLTKAAEACYWRQLFEGYGHVWNSSVPVWSDVYQRERGLRYESFILLDSQMMFDFSATGGMP